MAAPFVTAATVDDIPALAALIEEDERHYGSTRIQPLEERIDQTREALFGSPPMAFALVARDTEAGPILGFATYSLHWPAIGSTWSIYLKELYIRAPHRQRGIGRALMASVFDVAADFGRRCSRVEWDTDASNHDAIVAYARMGFRGEASATRVAYRVELGDIDVARERLGRRAGIAPRRDAVER